MITEPRLIVSSVRTLPTAARSRLCVNAGAVVLCGGESRRMGAAKAWLPFGPESMLQRVVRLLGQVVDSVTVAAAPGQELPGLPSTVRVVRDGHEGLGPLEGIRCGLAALPPAVEAAYVTACDVPFLVPAFVARMFELLGRYRVAVPRIGGRFEPLAAVYHRSVLQHIGRLPADDRRPVALFHRVPTRFVTEAELHDVDPELMTLRNVNYPEEYRDALESAGLAGVRPRVATC